jgi:hypothetical protein
VYPIVYPLPRRERMVGDHHQVLKLVADWARATAESRATIPTKTGGD